MKLIKYIYLLFIIAFLVPNNVHAQKKDFKNDLIVINGKIDGGQFGMDSIFVSYTPNIMCTYSTAQFDNRTDFYVHPDSNGKFSVTLPPAKDIGSIIIHIEGDPAILGKSPLPITDTTYPRYYVEPGDSIFMAIQINGGGDMFNRISGKGAAKYLAVNSIAKAMTIIAETLKNGKSNTPKFQMARLEQISKIRLQAQISLLNYYKLQISKQIFDLIYADIYGKELSQTVYRLFRYSSPDLRLMIKQFSPDLPTNLSAKSPYYINYLIIKTILIYQAKKKSKKYGTNDIYNQLKNNYHSLLRDKLITNYLLNVLYRLDETHSENNSGYNDCLKDAYITVQDKTLKKAVGEKLSKFKMGSQVYNFELPNASGEIVQLSDFKGKVVLIDIYGTICTGCRVFATTLKSKVFNEFKNNPNVVFIAISTETDKSRWLADIENGHNTSKDHEIILYTKGLGLHHPFIQYYQIQAVPTLILVDKEGKIANSSSNSLTAISPGEEIIEMIHNQLKKR